MTNIQYYLLLISSLLLASSCVVDDKKDDPEPEPQEKTANEWIVEKMRDVYLWNDEIPADKQLSFSNDEETFFYSLLSLKDGKDDYDANGSKYHYYYSNIKKKATTKSYMGNDYSYGFEFMLYYFTDLKKNALQILYVVPDSPADVAGLKRGDWITIINGSPVPSSSTTLKNLLYPGSAGTLTLGVSSLPNETEVTSVQLTARMIVDNPVLVHKTFNYNGINIGYLVYNHFTNGPEDNGQDETFNNSMREAFAQFKSEKPDEFILDLRYNQGGYLTCSQLLASMLAPASALSKKDIYCKTTDNKGKSTNYLLNSDIIGSRGANLDLKRLYVITTDITASASEAVINGLRPYMEVIVVGVQTEGKNVGSVTYTDSENKYDWELHPIVSSISNKNNESDYSNGFIPKYPCTEVYKITKYDLGDEREFILNQILGFIINGTSIDNGMPDNLRASDIRPEILYNSLERKKINSVILPAESTTY